MEWSLGGPLSEIYPMIMPVNQNCCHQPTSFSKGPYEKNVLKSSLELLGQLGPKYKRMVTLINPIKIGSDFASRY